MLVTPVIRPRVQQQPRHLHKPDGQGVVASAFEYLRAGALHEHPHLVAPALCPLPPIVVCVSDLCSTCLYIALRTGHEQRCLQVCAIVLRQQPPHEVRMLKACCSD